MDSKRQQKYARLIQKELGELFQRDSKSLFEGAFISVTNVRVSPDMGVVKVYLSFLLAKDKQALLDKVIANTKPIRKMLGDKIRDQARIIPELNFYIDDNVEYSAKMNDLFSKIDIPPSEEDEEKDKGNKK